MVILDLTLRVWNLYSTALAFLLCQVKLLDYPWVVHLTMDIVKILLSRKDSKTSPIMTIFKLIDHP